MSIGWQDSIGFNGRNISPQRHSSCGNNTYHESQISPKHGGVRGLFPLRNDAMNNYNEVYMQALLFWDELEFTTDYPRQIPQPDEALVRVTMAGICNTDLEITKGYMGFKGILGHEFVGVVDECDDREFWGRRVVGEINCGCGQCPYCQSGQSRHCPNRSVLGILKHDGAFADYLILPIRNLHLVPDSLSNEEAVFVEPLAAALQILEQVEIKPEHSVVVIGDGKLGLLVSMVMAQTNCHLTVIGKHQLKLNILTQKGISTILSHQVEAAHGSKPSVLAADIVIECSGHPSGFNLSQRIVKPMGKIVLKSTFAEEILFKSLANMIINEITLIGSRCGPFDKALSLLEKKVIDVTPLITAIYPIKNGIEAFETAKMSESLKVLIKI